MKIEDRDLAQFCRYFGCTVDMARAKLKDMNPVHRKRMLIAVNSSQKDARFLCDPIELDRIFGLVLQDATVRAEKAVQYRGIGSCHKVWAEKAKILKDEHGIDWFSPAEMNPWTLYD